MLATLECGLLISLGDGDTYGSVLTIVLLVHLFYVRTNKYYKS
jgi:hypothetical protein